MCVATTPGKPEIILIGNRFVEWPQCVKDFFFFFFFSNTGPISIHQKFKSMSFFFFSLYLIHISIAYHKKESKKIIIINNNSIKTRFIQRLEKKIKIFNQGIKKKQSR